MLEGLEIPWHVWSGNYKPTIKSLAAFTHLNYIRVPCGAAGVLMPSQRYSFAPNVRVCELMARAMFASCHSLQEVIFGDFKSCTVKAVRNGDGKVVSTQVADAHPEFLLKKDGSYPELGAEAWSWTETGRVFMSLLDGTFI